MRKRITVTFTDCYPSGNSTKTFEEWEEEENAVNRIAEIQETGLTIPDKDSYSNFTYIPYHQITKIRIDC